MNVLHIYNQSDLNKAIVNGIIDYSVYIHCKDISLCNIKKVNGYLGFANVRLIDLCDIEEIGGDLWVSTYHYVPESVNLAKLKIVNGSVNLNYTPLKSLGIIECIKGDLSLRDTDIKDLGSIRYIGGKLILPYSFKNCIDLSNIEIKGEVKFFKLSKKQKDIQRDLTPSDRTIPIVNPKNSFGFSSHYVCHLSDASKEQKEFYYYFKESFEKGIIIDVEGVFEYPQFLLDSMIEDEEKPLLDWLVDYDRLIKAYPTLNRYAAHKIRWCNKNFDLGWEILKRQSQIGLSDIGYYEEKLSKSLFDVELLTTKIEGALGLSPWGKQHLVDIIPFIQKTFDKFQDKWNRNFLRVFVDETLNPDKNYSFYKQFFVTDKQYNFYNNILYGKFLPTNYEKPLPLLVEHAIREQCKKITIEAEDSYRESIGMPKIGEYWRSETELYYSIKEAFKNTKVEQHGSPNWLGLQHLDVYIPEYNIGLEYQGVQHYRPVDYFGGEEAFRKGQERDARKRRLCKDNNCILLYVDEGYDLPSLIDKIRQIISSQTSTY